MTKIDKERLLYLLRTLCNNLYCEPKQHSGDPALLVEAFEVYCKIKKELIKDTANEQ